MTSVPAWLAGGSGPVPSSGGGGRGTPVLFLHGMGSTASIWLPQLEYFGSYRPAVAWTMPGYAGSPHLPVLGWDALADALCRLLDVQAFEAAHIVGHSIGGMVAQAFYQRYPSRVKSLVLSASSAAFGSRDEAWAASFLRQRTEALAPYASFAEALPALLGGLMGADTPPAMRALAILSGSGIEQSRYLEAMRLLVTFDQRDAFADIAVPMLLLAGELDTQAPPKGMERLALTNEYARCQVLPKVAHMANIEAADLFNEAVQQFLTELA